MLGLALFCVGLIVALPLARAKREADTEPRRAPNSVILVQLAVPVLVAVWSVVLFRMQPRLGNAIFDWVDTILGLAAGGAVVLIAMPIRYRHALNGQDIVAFSILAGALLIIVTFGGYMTAGFL